MKISETRIRQIIKEALLLEDESSMSILPPDVPPELFIGWMRRAYRDLPKPTGDLRKRFMSVAQRAGLEPRIAEEVVEFAITCLEPGEDFPFDIETAPKRIVEALGYDPRRSGRIIRQLHTTLAERVLGSQFDAKIHSIFRKAGSVQILFDLSHELGGRLPRDLDALGSVDREDLERGIDTMDALYVFAEPKEIPKSTRQKLMGMVGMGVEGALQAAEIYSML